MFLKNLYLGARTTYKFCINLTAKTALIDYCINNSTGSLRLLVMPIGYGGVYVSPNIGFRSSWF